MPAQTPIIVEEQLSPEAGESTTDGYISPDNVKTAILAVYHDHDHRIVALEDAPDHGTPPGGSTGQALVKTSNLDHKTGWGAPAPASHASTHAQAGSDPLTPSAIGAASAEHAHTPEVIYQPEPPANPVVGQLWVDSDGVAAEFTLPLAPSDGGMPPGGTIGQVLIKSSGEDYATVWADHLTDLGELSGSAQLIPPASLRPWDVSAEYVSPVGSRGSLAGFANEVYYTPILVMPGVIDRIGVQFATAGTADGQMRAAVYRNAGRLRSYPTARASDVVTFSGSTTAAQEAPVLVEVDEPEWFWVGGVYTGGGASMAVRSVANTSPVEQYTTSTLATAVGANTNAMTTGAWSEWYPAAPLTDVPDVALASPAVMATRLCFAFTLRRTPTGS